jgi:hypothetical protein
MIPLSLETIDYFTTNELQLIETFEFLVPAWGFNAKAFIGPDGKHHVFTKTEFEYWRKNKDLYSSPLYKALNETE